MTLSTNIFEKGVKYYKIALFRDTTIQLKRVFCYFFELHIPGIQIQSQIPSYVYRKKILKEEDNL